MIMRDFAFGTHQGDNPPEPLISFQGGNAMISRAIS